MTQLILTRAEPFLVSIDTKPLERAASLTVSWGTELLAPP